MLLTTTRAWLEPSPCPPARDTRSYQYDPKTMWETQQRQSVLISCQLLSRSSPSWPSAVAGGSLSPRRETPHRCRDASCSISTYSCFPPTTFSCRGFPAWHCSPLTHFHALSFGQVRGGRGCRRSPRAQGQASGGGHCPIEPARGGSGGLCSPHEKPIQVFLLPCTSRRGNAKPTGMKGTFCGAAHPAGRAFAVPVLRGEVASCKGQAPSSRSICVGFPARGRRVPRAELRGSISGLFPADTLLQGIPALPQQPFADFRANI